ncbi:MAG: ABC transporter permease [Gammaproteobacteria bacterium]|nr:ABC transporter permease [Gammaproteobacteria bacterium]MCH9745087.1 ABC transporter permease [Gammaproteobacteria bacterium]
MLMSDWFIWGLCAIAIAYFFWARRQPALRSAWTQILSKPLGMITMIILLFYISIGLLDSIHLKIDNTHTTTVLDLMVQPLGQQDEKSYSAPFATHLYSQSIITKPNGQEVRGYAPLSFASTHDIGTRIIMGFVWGFCTNALVIFALVVITALLKRISIFQLTVAIFNKQTKLAWRSAIFTFSFIWILVWITASLATHYHVLGTDKVGRDILYETLNSIRTGLIIGTLSTVFMLPFALIFGMMAGFFRGIVDDIIQYLYTTLSSIPGVLLISASILVLQVYISNHANLFPTLLQRADARLMALCFILGITSWASLCRLLRAETLKLREQDYILASRAMGVKPFKIIFRHVMPNVMHIVLITIVLDFSALVLAEAVLSYVGVGVDPTTMSWGNMINSSRLELAREPIVWWPLLSALVFMFILVLSANLFADKVRDAFDPRLHQS